MQFTNIYIMVNIQTCTSCLNDVKTFLSKKLKKKKKTNLKFFFMACYDKNVICDSTIQEKKLYDDMACYSMSC
jgi:hypothetical protein